MAYKVFISTGTSPEQQQALSAVKMALWDIHEFPISAITTDDVRGSAQELLEQSRQMIDGSHVFIGIYDAIYGPELAPDGRSLAEASYVYASQQPELVCLIFIQKDLVIVDERQAAFLRHLEEHHVISYYSDLDDLQARVKLSLSNFRQTMRSRRRLQTRQQNFNAVASEIVEEVLESPVEGEAGSVLDEFFTEDDALLTEEDEAPPARSGDEQRKRSAPAPSSASAPVNDESRSPSRSSGAWPWQRKDEEQSGAESPPAPAPAPIPPPQPLPSDAIAVPMPEPVEALPEVAEALSEDEATRIDSWVNRALEVATDDIEQIMSRALELHDARQKVQREGSDRGWLSVNPIFGEPLQQSQFQADIFMIMPFREQFNAIYQNVVRPVSADLNLTVKRGDDFSSVSGSIMQEVWAAINACRLVIAETTEVNANVYYELGIAHTLGKPAILLTQLENIDELPFDIRHLRFIVYENTISGGEKLEKDLRRSIVWLLNDLDER